MYKETGLRVSRAGESLNPVILNSSGPDPNPKPCCFSGSMASELTLLRLVC